ncbi:unnamed protein product, partial [marine sediment metagenome]
PLFFDYILDDVPALALKRDMLWKRAQESDFLTLDEKRELVGKEKYEPTDDPGSMIFIEASKIPIGVAVSGESEKETEEEEEKARQDLIDQGYTEDEIDDLLGYTYGEEEKVRCQNCGTLIDYGSTNIFILSGLSACNSLKIPLFGPVSWVIRPKKLLPDMTRYADILSITNGQPSPGLGLFSTSVNGCSVTCSLFPSGSRLNSPHGGIETFHATAVMA